MKIAGLIFFKFFGFFSLGLRNLIDMVPTKCSINGTPRNLRIIDEKHLPYFI